MAFREQTWLTHNGVWVLTATNQDAARNEVARHLRADPSALQLSAFRRIPGPDRDEVTVLDIETGDEMTLADALDDWRAYCRAYGFERRLPHRLAETETETEETENA
jgi:hypothetical protein